MNLFSPRITQKLYDTGAGSASYNRVINHNNALALGNFRNGVKLDFNLVLTAFLPRSDKGSCNIFILNKAQFVGNTRLL